MKKRTEYRLKAETREIKKRPRMKVSGVALKRASKFAAMKIVKKKK